MAHGIRIFGFSQMVKQSGMPYYLVEGALLILGSVIYAASFTHEISISILMNHRQEFQNP